jgi:hypothetical protein
MQNDSVFPGEEIFECKIKKNGTLRRLKKVIVKNHERTCRVEIAKGVFVCHGGFQLNLKQKYNLG